MLASSPTVLVHLRATTAVRALTKKAPALPVLRASTCHLLEPLRFPNAPIAIWDLQRRLSPRAPPVLQGPSPQKDPLSVQCVHSMQILQLAALLVSATLGSGDNMAHA